MLQEFVTKFKLTQLKIYESKHWIWSLREGQVTLGSGVISLKREVEKLSDVNAEEYRDLSTLIEVVEKTLTRVFCYDKINYLALMMVDKQVHFHVISRYERQISFANYYWIDKDYPRPPVLNTQEISDIQLMEIHALLEKESNFFGRKTIGYTTGVFDLFHVGHLNILKKAKENCDYLIVGVSTDELVFNYKNKRPIIPYEERAAIIKAISFVDEVVPQVDRDKFGAWQKYKFHKMFVGSDWKGTTLFTELEKRFAAENVEIVFFPYTEGTSSTILREKLDKIK